MRHCNSIVSVLKTGLNMAKLGLASLLFALIVAPACAQIEDPVNWDFGLYPSEQQGLHDLVIHAAVDTCWHIYSQDNNPDDGPVPTEFGFEWPTGLIPQGSVQECTPIEEYDPNFMLDLKFFEEHVYWRQTVDLSEVEKDAVIQGYVYFMVCDERMCLPPEEVPIEVKISDIRSEDNRPEYCAPPQEWCDHGESAHAGDAHLGEQSGLFSDKDSSDKGTDSSEKKETSEDSLLWTFLLGFGLGLAALLTPCVFPMIPMTVSFFTKQSKTRTEGIRNALTYGFFIIFIYTALGLALTAFFGVDILLSLIHI